MKNNKGVIHFLLLLLAALAVSFVVGGIVYLSQNPLFFAENETGDGRRDNLSKFVNPEFQYAFSYLPNWEVDQFGEAGINYRKVVLRDKVNSDMLVFEIFKEDVGREGLLYLAHSKCGFERNCLTEELSILLGEDSFFETQNNVWGFKTFEDEFDLVAGDFFLKIRGVPATGTENLKESHRALGEAINQILSTFEFDIN